MFATSAASGIVHGVEKSARKHVVVEHAVVIFGRAMGDQARVHSNIVGPAGFIEAPQIQRGRVKVESAVIVLRVGNAYESERMTNFMRRDGNEVLFAAVHTV